MCALHILLDPLLQQASYQDKGLAYDTRIDMQESSDVGMDN